MKNLKVGDVIMIYGGQYSLVGFYRDGRYYVSFMKDSFLNLEFEVKSVHDITKEEFEKVYPATSWTYADGSPIYPEPAKTYEIGQRFVSPYGDEYILAQVDNFKVAMICLDGGNRYENPYDVDNPCKITQDVIDCIGENFTLIK